MPRLKGDRMKQAVPVVLANIVILGFLIFAVDAALILRHQINKKLATGPDRRADLVNYADESQARQHFAELLALPSSYESFVGWRRLPFRGQTITIDENGLRQTANAIDRDRAQTTIAFFGGSTMWGTGVDDEQTIPSLLAASHPGFYAMNFGETAYIARQSLNLALQQYTEGLSPDIVVFYDGANEILHKCRRELSPFSHAREVYIRDAIELYGNGMSYSALFYPIQQLAEEVSKEVGGRTKPSYFYDCDRDADKAERIARALLWDWLAAKNLVESAGGRFLAILQPVAYLGAPEVRHLDLDEDLGRQFVSVYPHIRSLLPAEFPSLQRNFADFGDVFDGEEPIYIDFCHVSPNGNEIVAARISDVLGRWRRDANKTSN